MTDSLHLLCGISESTTLSEIANLAFEALGNPVFICDVAHNVLAYTTAADIKDPFWNNYVTRESADLFNLQKVREITSMHNHAGGNAKTWFAELPQLPYRQLTTTLTADGQILGVLVLSPLLKPFEEGDKEFLEILSIYITRRMEREGRIALSAASDLNTFFITLLEGNPISSEKTQDYMKQLGWRLGSYSYILVVRPETVAGKTPILGAVMDELARTPGFRGVIYRGRLVLFFSSEKSVSDWLADVPALEALCKKYSVQIGVSRSFDDLRLLRTRHREAVLALRLGCTLDVHHRLYTYNSLSMYHMVDNMLLAQTNLRDYCHEKILLLAQEESGRGGDLLVTLQVYLEHAKSLMKTAEILHLHRNTINYRINKCMQIMQTDMEDGNEIFSFIFSLRLLNYERAFLSAEKASE